MKKYFFLSVIALLFCLAGIAGCGQKEPPVSSVKLDVTVRYEDGNTVLEWNRTEGVTYEVLKAPSRYAAYTAAGGGDGVFTDGGRYGYYKVSARNSEGYVIGVSDPVSEELDLFQENAYVFAPTDDEKEVGRILSSVYSEMERAHFSDARYAFFFKEGDYGFDVKVPYFTTVSGLGESRDGVLLSSLSADGKWNGNALVNFWRGAENLTLKNTSRWAVSQGTFLRGVEVRGDLYLFDYDNYRPGVTSGNEASGGFLADSRVTGTVYSGSQQQWFTRDSELGGWEGSVWNMVFAEVDRAPSGDRFTAIDALPLVREKPHLVFGGEGYSLLVPAPNGSGAQARRIPESKLYFASPKDAAARINEQIAAGKDVVFTPGVYRLSEPIRVEREGAVLLGTGLATLLPTNGNACLTVSDAADVCVCGLLFDAGSKRAEALAVIGKEGEMHESDPVCLFDCFFRVGGNSALSSYAGTSLLINAGGTVVDNAWLWRADHGSGVGWEKNNGDFGLVVKGDKVKCYGLFAEHYKKNNVLWKGDGGYLAFYQSELAYDVPASEAWESGSGKGYPSFLAEDGVKSFTAFGMGIYSNFQTEGIELDCAVKVPSSGGVYLGSVCAFAMSAKGRVNNLVNDDGLAFSCDGGDARFRSVRDLLL